jgi:serine protease
MWLSPKSGPRVALAGLLAAWVSSAAAYVPSGGPGEQSPAAPSAAPVTQETTGRLIIKFRDTAGASSAEAASASVRTLSQSAGIAMRHIRITGGGEQVVSVEGVRSIADLEALAVRLRQLPDVEYAEPDVIMQPQQVNDPRFAEQWHYTQAGVGINLPPAWQRSQGTGVVVAVIDTGIRPHADLAANILPGRDLITDPTAANDGGGRDADAADPGDWVASGDSCFLTLGARNSSWHGTHVAGTIAAVTNNGTGVAGVAPAARILPVRVLGKCGGALSDIADGIRWSVGISVPGVTDNATPARVLNLSLGGSGACGPTYTAAIRDAVQRGATVVVAAGNSDMDASNFRPANCADVVTVAATNRQGGRAFFGGTAGSNFGTMVEIAAPGGETHAAAPPGSGILSTLNSGGTTPAADNYAFYQGTSMATPHVSGVVAMMYAANPAITPAQVLRVLQQTAQPFPTVAQRQCTTTTCGAGIVNAAAAVEAAAAMVAPISVGPGAIWRYTGQPCAGESCPGWQLLDNNSATAVALPAGNQLYQLHTTGRIWRYTGQPCDAHSCPGWQMLDNNGASLGLVAANQLYQLHNTGRIWRHTGQACTGESCPGWQMLDNNGATIAIVASGGELYQLHNTGRIWRHTGQACAGESCPGWQMLDNNGATVQIAAGNQLYQLHDSGRIWRHTGQPCAGESCPGWQMLDNNGATAMIVAAGERLYQLHNTGRIWRHTGQACTGESCPGWQMLDNNGATIAIVASGGELYQLHNTGRIWRHTGQACAGESCPGWQMLDNNAATGRIAVSSGNLYQIHTQRRLPARVRDCLDACRPH